MDLPVKRCQFFTRQIFLIHAALCLVYHYIRGFNLYKGSIMDGVKQQIHARQLESLENKHIYKVKKIKRDMRAELDRLRENSEAAVSKVKSGYDRKVMDEKLDLEKKLTDLRKKNEIMLKEEDERYKKMLDESKLAHAEQIAELENSQQKEIENQKLEHEEYLNTVEKKFESEKIRMG
tara:strand:- start:23987 stop:24520 length:534 start_codon:yes stop_codon:yes gene_type:complete